MSIRLFVVGLGIAALLLGPQTVGAAVDLRVTAGDRKIIVFEDNVSDEVKQQILAEAGSATIKTLDSIDAKIVVTGDADADTLEARPEVKRVEDDIRIAALRRVRTAPSQVIPWGIERVGAPAAWGEATGTSIRVAIVDTGIDLDHPDLARNVVDGYNAITPSRSADDDNGHGSHVAGIVGAVNNSIGSVGVAVDSRLVPVKVLDRRGYGYLSDIIEGIDWAVANDVDIINLSLGTSIDMLSLRESVQNAIRANVVVVAAAGNGGREVLYPAAYEGVIAVGATDEENGVPRWSSRGSTLDLVAPGEDIFSTYEEGKYRQASGTSMAAPHVAGVAALLLDDPRFCDSDGDNRCSPAEVENRLKSTATDVLSAGRDDTSGAGLLSAARALGR